MAETRPSIGLIGVGLMGLPMSLRLLERGYAVTVLDEERTKLGPALAQGAREARAPAEVARASEVVLVCVTGTEAVEEVVFGPGGVHEAATPDKLLVDHSTTDAGATRRLAARLAQASGMAWIDAPMSGGPPAAEAGALTIMAGGAAQDIDRVRPLMAELAGHFTHIGPTGAGQVAKMINQIIVLTNFCVLAEALKLAENAGIDAARIPEALAGGYADGAMLQKHYPRMLARAFEPPGGYARVVLKDLDMVHDLAKATGTATPMSSQAATLYRLMVARGHGHLDGTAVLKLWDQD
ncbi:MAG: NAD(P)-dependent oxidoreductase [Alphaproteobacteria bacterium]